MTTAEQERADVLAYLRARRRACGVMVANSPEFAEAARERDRQLAVMIDEISAGFHLGAAAVEAGLVEKGEGEGL
jgi:hypothetical protein